MTAEAVPTDFEAQDDPVQIEHLLAEGRAHDASARLERVFAEGRFDQDAAVALANLCRRLGKRELIAKYLLRARELGPLGDPVLFELGLTQLNLGWAVDANRSFSDLTERAPDRAEYWRWRARSGAFLGNPDRARVAQDYDRSLRLAIPDDHLVEEVLIFCLNEVTLADPLLRSLREQEARLSARARAALRLHEALIRGPDVGAVMAAIEPVLAEARDRRLVIVELQQFCRAIFVEPLLFNGPASLLALDACVALGRHAQALGGFGPVPPVLERAWSHVGTFLAGRDKRKALIVVHTSSQYFSAFRAWYKRFQKFDLDHRLLLVALDGRAVTHVLDEYPWLGDKVFLFPVFPTLHMTYGDGYSSAFYWYVKNRLLREIVAAGHTALQADADAFWNRDAMLLFEYEFEQLGTDIVSQQEGGVGTIALPQAVSNHWGHVLCAGFWGVRAGAKSVRFLDRLCEYTLLIWDDQVGLNQLLRDSSPGWEGQPGGRLIARADVGGADGPVTIAALPRETATRNIWKLEDPDVAIVHGQYFRHEQWVDGVIFDRSSADRRGAVGVADHARLAGGLIEAGYWREAAEVLPAVLSAEPDRVDAWLKLGIASKVLGRPAAALDALGEVLRRDPHHVHAHMWMGLAMADLGDLVAAIGAFDQALAQDPGHANGYLQKALVLERMGEIARAGEVLRAGLAAVGDDGALRDTLARVEAGGA